MGHVYGPSKFLQLRPFWLLRPDGRDVRLVLSRAGFEPPRVRSFACPELKKSPHLFRVSQSTGNGPAHSQGNGPLCKGGTRCSGVFSACVRRSSSLSTKLRGLSAHRRPSFFLVVFCKVKLHQIVLVYFVFCKWYLCLLASANSQFYEPT